MSKHTAYVLHSGGIDSSTVLYMAAEMYDPKNVIGVSINYGQRHFKEIEQALAICDHLGCRHEVLRIEGMPSSMLTDPNREIPNVSYEEIRGVSPTYVPFRNGQLLSKITARAVSGLEPPEGKFAPNSASIWFGAHAEDAVGWAYPDCTPEFIGAMANAIYIGTYHQVRLVAPLMYSMKFQIILAGQRLGVPWPATWSCYAGEKLHCGTCPTCRARNRAFLPLSDLRPLRTAFLTTSSASPVSPPKPKHR